ncbi:MAG: hypothetical protein QXR89_01385 [Candidatus Bathyarchaeia archaeon]
MAVISLFLSIIFRRKLNRINMLGSYVKPEIYSRSFVVFDPYSSKITVFHRFLLLAVVAVWSGCLLLLYVFFKVLEYGLLFPLILIIICLNIMPLEVTFEAYENSKIFIQALLRGGKLGVGDVEVLEKLKRILKRLSNYCFGLFLAFLFSALFFVAARYWLNINLNSFFAAFPNFLASWGFFGIFFLTCLFAALFVFGLAVTSRIKKFLLDL